MPKINPCFLDGRQHDPLEFINYFLTIINQKLVKNNNFYLDLNIKFQTINLKVLK